MDDPPLDPQAGSAALVVAAADVLARVMLHLVARGSLSGEEALQVLTAQLHPDPRDRVAVARQLVIEHAMLRLAAPGPGRGSA